MICDACNDLCTVKYLSDFHIHSSLGLRYLYDIKPPRTRSNICSTDSRILNLNRRHSISMTNHLERITSGASFQKGNNYGKKRFK